MTEYETPDYSTVWNVDALLNKSKRYVEKMLAAPRDEWEFALWSSLALEFLLRAALAGYGKALLAETKGNDVNHLLMAMGIAPKVNKYIPNSIQTNEVIERLSRITDDFNSELAGFCKRHTSQRNAELHSGQLAFDGVKHSTWLPIFYKTCDVLLTDLDRKMSDLFPEDECEAATKMIATLADEAAKSVKATINAHQTAWQKKDQLERDKASKIAEVWATKHSGHRVTCPACKSVAIVIGDPISAAKKSIDGDMITEKQEHLPNKFECVACGMKIAGLSQLNVAELGNVYVQSQSYDASEYYAAPAEDLYDGYEPDNNEF
jgi:hypothetical protein